MPVEAKIGSDTVVQLLRSFDRAQFNQVKALEHRQKLEREELLDSLKPRQRAYAEEEREKRLRFFKENRAVDARRNYLYIMESNRRAFEQSMRKEIDRQKEEFDDRMTALKEEQEKKRKDFLGHLRTRKRPPDTLWPRPGW